VPLPFEFFLPPPSDGPGAESTLMSKAPLLIPTSGASPGPPLPCGSGGRSAKIAGTPPVFDVIGIA
jgi:hypothetical protein